MSVLAVFSSHTTIILAFLLLDTLFFAHAAKHERLAILYLHGRNTMVEWKTCRFWQGVYYRTCRRSVKRDMALVIRDQRAGRLV
jgi:hypothetical protein